METNQAYNSGMEVSSFKLETSRTFSMSNLSSQTLGSPAPGQMSSSARLRSADTFLLHLGQVLTTFVAGYLKKNYYPFCFLGDNDGGVSFILRNSFSRDSTLVLIFIWIRGDGRVRGLFSHFQVQTQKSELNFRINSLVWFGCVRFERPD